MAAPKVSLTSQINAVEAVVDGSSAGWKGARRDLHRDHLQAALATLRAIRQHEAAVRRAIAAEIGRPS